MQERKLTYEELAQVVREEDEKVASGREGEGYVRVPGVAGKPDHALIVRFTPDEIALVRQQAEAKGLKVSEYVREAVLTAARHGDAERPAIVREVQDKIRELSEAASQL